MSNFCLVGFDKIFNDEFNYGMQVYYSKDTHEVYNLFYFTLKYLENGEIESLSTWKYAVNEGVKLENIGFTGIDNGLIKYKKDRISNEDFLNIYLNSKYEIPSDRKALFLTPISGNTQEYVYPLPEWQEKEGYTMLQEKEYL